MSERRAHRILVVEDSPTQAEHLRLMLEVAGFDVVCAVDAREALDLADGQAFDLVLTDVRMPGVLDGLGLLKALRADPMLEAIPVMMLSADGGEEAQVAGLAAGADDYIVKPFGARELVARVEGAIRLARLRSEVAARDQELETARAQARLRLALDAAKMGEVIFNVPGGSLIHTPGFAALFGCPGDQPLTLAELRDRYHPDDRDSVEAHQAQVIAGSDPHYEIEHRVVWPDGSVHWLAGRGELTADRSGFPGEITAVYMDVTQRKIAEERQKLLLDELNHRVKNTLSTVQSILLQTRHHAQSAAEFDASFDARLKTLSRVHDLLSQRAWDGAALSDIIGQTLAPHVMVGAAGARNIEFGGPAVHLGPNAAVTLGMAFHELATNACKYGALSSEGGRLDVLWTLDRKVAPGSVRLVWTESGGPLVQPPSRRGFGTRLVEGGLGRELEADVKLDYDPLGLRCTITVPISRKLAAG